MPIITLQRRLREVGRLRLGVQKTKGDRSYPAKLSTFRFTSQDEAAITAAAELYGGTAQPWENQGRQEWEVITKARAIEVIVPPADMAFSQFMELWSGGGCQRRCDGERELLSDQPCLCDPDDKACAPTTRLSVMIPELPAVGLWRLESHGYNAAEELAGSVDLARACAERGQYIPAQLRVELREKKKPGEPTKKFAVPALDLHVSIRHLQAIAGGAAPAELDAGPGFTPVPPLAEGPQPSVAAQLAQVGQEGPGRPRSNAAEPMRPTGLKPRARGGAPADEESAAGQEDSLASSSEPVSDAGEAGVAGTAADSSASPISDDMAKRRAQQIAMYCKDEGVESDDDRHHFLEAFSQGRCSSAKQVPVEDVAGMRAALVRLRKEELRLEERDGRWQLVEAAFDWESTNAGGVDRRAEALGHDAQAEAVPGEWNAARWLDAVEHVAGIGQAKLLKRARALAEELEVAVPNDLDHVTDERLVVALLKWLREQQAAA